MDIARYKGKEPQEMRVDRSATIDQPVDRVFEYVSTPDNDPTWVPASLRHEMLSPPPIPATIRVLLKPLDGARTKVILVGEVGLRGIYKPMELVMRLVAQRQFG